MSTKAQAQAPAADPVVVFRLRCECRARLWFTGEVDLHCAIDEMQSSAVASGLVAQIGQDAVQKMLADAFTPKRDELEPAISVESSDSTFAEACRKADAKQRGKPRESRLEFLRRLLDDDVAPDRAYSEIQSARRRDRAAASTIEALMFSLRESGIAALHELAVLNRLAQLNETQLCEVGDRLQRLEIAPPWSPADVTALIIAWEEVRYGR